MVERNFLLISYLYSCFCTLPQFCLFITVTSSWARWRLKSPASLLFTQPFGQMQIKENIKAPSYCPLCGEFAGDRLIPRTNGQLRENASIWWHHVFSLSIFFYSEIFLYYVLCTVIFRKNKSPRLSFLASVFNLYLSLLTKGRPPGFAVNICFGSW